jgi:hypothetical protein
MRLIKFIFFGLIVLPSSNTFSKPPDNQGAGVDEIRIYDMNSYVNANKLLMFVTNKGSYAYDQGAILGKSDGLYYPYQSIEDILNGVSTNTVMFAAGVWIGGVNTTTGDTLISAAEYSDDYFPGPIAGGTFIPGADTDSQYRVYKLYSDSVTSNPNQDFLDWPTGQGAPVDTMGNPLLQGDQTLWSVYNDANPIIHYGSPSTNIGLGVEIQHTAWATSGEGIVPYDPEEVSIYSKYKIINKSSNSYEQFFISLWFDPDIGDAGDDFIGCDTLLDIFYCYNDGPDDDYGDAPPTMGGKLLEGPIVPSLGDIAYVDGIPVPGFKNLRMYSFMRYINGTDPNSPLWTYQYMNGLNAANGGAPLANGTRYAVPGDPVAGTGDIDTDSRDVRMMATFGPLDFAPNDTQQIVFKISVGQGESALNSITELKEVLNFMPPNDSQLVTSISPEPQHVIFMNAYESFNDTIFVGWSNGGLVTDINGASLVVNETIIPVSASMLPSHPGHSGPVWALLVEAEEFLSPYGWVYGTVNEPYNITGEFTDASPLSVAGTFEYVGHIVGDINRNGRIDIVDLTDMINFIFRNGPVPEPPESADMNEDNKVNALDLLAIINVIFRNG